MNIIKQSCVLFLWMHTLTFVDSQPCTLEQFKSGKLYDENFDTSEMESQYDGGKQIRVPCNVGFSGFFKLICVQGGWQHRGTQCKAKSCGHPGDAQFADFNLAKGDDFVFGSQVVYTCHKGYQMVSRSNTRHCMADGWDGVVPVCEAQHCPVLHVDNNVHVNGDTEEAVYGNVVRFSCKSSAEIVEGPTEIYCDENGEWSDVVPKCKEIKCEAPVITNGSVHQRKNVYKENEYIDFSCEYGYKKTEERATKCTKVGNGAVFIPTPACEPVRCKLDLPAPEGTTYNPPFLSIFVPGDRITVECGDKYYITNNPQETSVVSVCKQNGDWSIIPTCKEVTCRNQRPQNVYSWQVYWRQQLKLGDTVSYSCTSGYRRKDGATEATCTRNGWSPNPLCEELPCDRYSIKNADIENDKETYTQGERANYVCKNGYKGSFSLTCTERGMWTGHQNCQEIICRRQIIDNADFEGRRATYRYNEQARYVCKNGRRFSLICKEEGWIGQRQCDGCLTPQVPNGFFVVYNETMFYTCNNGYKLVTKGWWGKATCKDSLWSGLHTCIEEDKCGNVPVIPNGQATGRHKIYGDGDSIQITCNKEYTVEIDRLICTGGKWNLDGETLKTVCRPNAQPCGPPFKVDNAVVKASYRKKYLSGSTVTYQCRYGYSTQDETTITCINGNWEPRQITCESSSTIRIES